MNSAVSDLRQLSYAVQAHESVLDTLVNKTKECPSLAILLPCKRSWKDWLSPTVLTQNKFMLTFLCPVSLCVVEFGPKGLGMEVAAPKEWVKKWGPALLVTLKVLHVAVAAGRVLGVPLPSLPSSDSLGLSSGKDGFLKDFMASSWNQIASQCSVDDSLDKAQSQLKSSLDATIPPLESASPDTVKALKHTDEAYKAIHAYLCSFGPVEDQFRGKMSREKYRGQVDWISVQMVQRWREQIDQRAQPAAVSTTTSSSTTYVSSYFHPPLTGIVVESGNDGATTEPVLFPWLVEKLEQSTKMKRADIVKCVNVLVQEGIDDELVFADIPPERFDISYLDKIGITSLGVQQRLLQIHKSLVEQRPAKGASSSSTAGSLKNDNKIVDAADAREVAALKLEVARANENASEAAKNAAEMKSNLDAFMDATGVSAGGQMQRAVRTKDGRVMVEVTSPGTDQRLDAVSNTVAVNRDEVDFEIQELQHRLERLEKTNKKR